MKVSRDSSQHKDPEEELYTEGLDEEAGIEEEKDKGIVLKAPAKEPTFEIPAFSDITKDDRVNFSDVYMDARTFLAKANSTKFVIVAFILILSPFLLIWGHISEEVYREIILIASLAYIGVDAYQTTKSFGRRRR